MKFLDTRVGTHLSKSLPVRGAWVEIRICQKLQRGMCCRSPCGERGLKWVTLSAVAPVLGRSPCGERGLNNLGH